MVDGVTRIDLPGRKWGMQSANNMLRGMPYFVAGPENNVTVIALEQLLYGNGCAEDHRGSTDNQSNQAPFSPLVLLGATGCGKTHLAHGLANHWRNGLRSRGERPEKAAYLSAVEFGRIYDQAREQNKLAELRESLRSLQLFVLEDLHAIRLRGVIQLELRQTVDTLLTRGALILVTSQKPLATIPSLEPGLRDRLYSGLTIRLKPPGEAARLDILQLAARVRGTDLNMEQAQRMSQHLEGPVPRLFRAIAELEQDSLVNKPNSPVFAEKLLSMRQIVAVVARYFSLSQTLLRGPSRRRSVVQARNVAVYLARVLTNLSYAQVARDLGNRDHTTAMHAYRQVRQLLNIDPTTQETVDDLKRILTAA